MDYFINSHCHLPNSDLGKADQGIDLDCLYCFNIDYQLVEPKNHQVQYNFDLCSQKNAYVTLSAHPWSLDCFDFNN